MLLFSDMLVRYASVECSTCSNTTCSNDNSLQVVELSGPQICKLLSTHPSKPFPRRFSGPESVCSG